MRTFATALILSAMALAGAEASFSDIFTPPSTGDSKPSSKSSIKVNSLEPSSGSTEGNIWVRVKGEKFDSEAKDPVCLFRIDEGTTRTVPAWVESESKLWCKTPKIMVERTIDVMVSMNGGKDTSNSKPFDVIQYVFGTTETTPMMKCGSSGKAKMLVQLSSFFKKSHRSYKVELWEKSKHQMIGSTHVKVGKTSVIHFDMSKLPEAPKRIVFELLLPQSPDESGAHSYTGTFYFMPCNEKAVWLDHLRQTMVVDGTPFLPTGIVLSGQHSLDHLMDNINMLARKGVNFVTILGSSLWSSVMDFPQKLISLMEHMSASGVFLKVDLMEYVDALCLSDDPTKSYYILQQIEQIVQSVRGHPMLLGYQIAGDLKQMNRKCLIGVYDRIKEMDPYHPIFGGVLGKVSDAWAYFGTKPCVDVPEVIFSDQQNPDKQLDVFSYNFPFNFVPQFLSGLVFDWRGTGLHMNYPALQQYLAVMTGAKGLDVLAFWIGSAGSVSDTAIETVKSAAHLHELSSAFRLPITEDSSKLYPEIKIKTYGKDTNVVARVFFEPESKLLTIMTANLRKHPVSVRFTVPMLKDYISDVQTSKSGLRSGSLHDESSDKSETLELHALFEMRGVSVNAEGTFYDKLGSFGCRTYRLNLGGSDEGTTESAEDSAHMDSSFMPSEMQEFLPMSSAVSSSAQDVEKGKQLILNGNFEEFVRALTPSFYGIMSFGVGTPGLRSLKSTDAPGQLLDTNVVHNGRHSLKLISPDPGTSLGMHQIVITRRNTWQPGYKYKFKFFARTGYTGLLQQDVIIEPALEGFIHRSNYVEYQRVWSEKAKSISTANTWQSFESTIEIPKNIDTNYHLLIIYIRGHSPIWLDDLSLQRVE